MKQINKTTVVENAMATEKGTDTSSEFTLADLPTPKITAPPPPPSFIPVEQTPEPDPFAWSDIKSIVRVPAGFECQVKFAGLDDYVSFLACADDPEPHGRAIHAECLSGRWGKVIDYLPSEAELLSASQDRITRELRRANAQVTIYQDRADVGRASKADIAALLAWKTYRVDLNELPGKKGGADFDYVAEKSRVNRDDR